MSLLVPGTDTAQKSKLGMVQTGEEAGASETVSLAASTSIRTAGAGLSPPGTAGSSGLAPPSVAHKQATLQIPTDNLKKLELTASPSEQTSHTRQQGDPHRHNPEAIEPVRAPQDHSTLPNSYRTNSRKENEALLFVQNFVRQYRHLYNNRKPLFINPPNECGVPKFVCTTVKPTLLPYKQLYDHGPLSAFVADYLTYEFLTTRQGTDTPPILQSPATTIWNQRGNSFDFSVVLCSLLEGAGYDAYCVYGYAKREVCMMDRSRREVQEERIKPEPPYKHDTTKPTKSPKKNKYNLEPKLTLKSKYDMMMADRSVKEAEEKKAADIIAAAAVRREQRKPADDPLLGLRVHCWVLVLRGKRGVPENFFIEPSLGESCSTISEDYLGIEAIWNSKNYWVNMQDCSDGVKDMNYDLGDSASWEYVLPDPLHPIVTNGLPSATPAGVESGKLAVDMPKSWVEEIKIEPTDFEMRCPHGKREFVDENARTQIFAEYLRPDGRVKEVTFYEDYELDQKTLVVEMYAHRNDKLIKRETKYTAEYDQIDEIYLPGTSSELRHHIYFRQHSPSEDKGRVMYFYDHSRVDGLYKREKSKFQLRETFNARDDFLAKRVVDFVGGTTASKTRRRSSILPSHIPKLNVTLDHNEAEAEINHEIEVITETYNRNTAKAASDDIAEVVFLEEAVLVTYHKDRQNITAQRREIEKPEPDPKVILRPPVHSDGVLAYVTDMKKPSLRNFENNRILDDLLDMEDKSRSAIKAALDETTDILTHLKRDDANVKLNLSFYDTTRNAESKARREKLEKEAREEAARRAEMERDYLAPFLVRLSQPQTEIPGMRDHVEKMLARSKNAADWQDEEKWSDELMTMFDVELDIFLAGSNFTEEEKKDLKERRRKEYVKGVADQCMTDFHNRNTAKEKRINTQIEQEKRALSDKQKWYLEHQSTLRPEQEEEYVNYCSELIFRIGIFEKRLVEHREDSRKQEYMLENKLHNDSRLEGLM